MLRGALIGLGNIATRGHIPAFLTDRIKGKLRITAVFDVVSPAREICERLLPSARFYTDFRKMIDEERPDFIDICTPPVTHAEFIAEGAERGIHVICEKPLTENVSKVKELRDRMNGARIVFLPCHQYIYSPLWSSIRDVIAGGALGGVTLAQFNVFRLQADSGTAAWNPAWRTNKNQSGGGILVDTGAHYFYLIQQFFGLPRTVHALLPSLRHKNYDVEDTAISTLEYENLVAQITLTWAADSRANSVYIVGSDGNLSYDGHQLLLSTAAGKKNLPMPDVSDKSQYVEWYASLFEEFERRVVQKDFGTDRFAEAVNVMKLLDLSYRSAAEGRVLEFE